MSRKPNTVGGGSKTNINGLSFEQYQVDYHFLAKRDNALLDYDNPHINKKLIPIIRIELILSCENGILNPTRLPIPPYRH